MTAPRRLSAGRPWPLGVTPDETGANVAVFSANATVIHLCLFDRNGREVERIRLPEREGDIRFGHIEGLRPGQRYGLRADGPYAPDAGHRFNANKLLLDPYAQRLTGHPTWHPALMGYKVGHSDGDLSFDARDSAPYMPQCVITAPWSPLRSTSPRRRLDECVIYEAHVKGLTRTWPGMTAPGTFAALASDPVIEHMTRLGITAVELLPVHAFITDGFLADKGMVNYWGYQTLGFFAPDPRYLSKGDPQEMRDAVDRLHDAGIEVILDVVYNHTCEAGAYGPTLSFRGLDNASYYRLAEGGRGYINDTGTGNTVQADHPMVLRMILDSLRHWAEVYGIDGVRFDLGATLGRRATGFDRRAPLFDAMRQDPVLTQLKLIMEPWDIGPGGYQLGQFPAPFAEWNDRYRDSVRKLWRGDPRQLPEFASRLTGSADYMDHDRRLATASVNFVTAHDGFTLTDLVSYNRRHNEANGEDGRDGHNANYSNNCGVEGPSDDPDVLDRRARRRRNLMASLLVSQGVPMILAGDETGNSQGGNNNAYAMDNETGWIDWTDPDWAFCDFVRRAIALRHSIPQLRQRRFLHGRVRSGGTRGLIWRRPDGVEMTQPDWTAPDLRVLLAEMRMAAKTPPHADRDDVVLLAFNTGSRTEEVALPETPEGMIWWHLLETAKPELDRIAHGHGPLGLPGPSLSVLHSGPPP